MWFVLGGVAWAQASEPPYVLSKEVERVRGELETSLTPETCPALLEQVFHDLEHLKVEEVDLQDVQDHASDIVLGTFRARVEAQEAIARFAADGTLTHACVTGLRRADIASRYLVDHVYEQLPDDTLPGDWLVAGVDGPTFATEPPALRSGDVLVTRATMLSSAGIAHLGGIDSQFSHNALVWVAPDGTPYTVEAYMEKGAVVETVDAFLHSGLGRVVVLRHQDAELAARAAEAVHTRVATGPFLPYDDKFELDDPSRLFCSEVPRWAYGGALGLPATVPWDLTKLPRDTDARFFDAMGITVSETSMPADVLFDPNFSIVAEWRDPAMLPRMRRHDAIAESAYRWMEEDGYAIDPSTTDEVTVTVGLALRRMPVLSQLVKDKLLPTSSPEFLVTGLAFDEAGAVIDQELVRRMGGEGRGVPRTAWLDALEQMRSEDLSTWEDAPKDVVFHDHLHPTPSAPTTFDALGAEAFRGLVERHELRPDDDHFCNVGVTLPASGEATALWSNHLPACLARPTPPDPLPAAVVDALAGGAETCVLKLASSHGRTSLRGTDPTCAAPVTRYLRKEVRRWQWNAPEDGEALYAVHVTVTAG